MLVEVWEIIVMLMVGWSGLVACFFHLTPYGNFMKGGH